MEKLIDEFEATTEHGETITLSVIQEIIPAGDFNDPHATLPGLKRVEDDQGNAVNVKAPGQYEIIGRDGYRTMSATGRSIRD